MILRFRMAKTAVARRGASMQGRSAAKIFSALYPCNPLISLVLVERIQGNPSFSNGHWRGVSQRNGGRSRKPKSADERANHGRKRGLTGSIAKRSA
jgi:hypothetical protein